MKLNIDPRIDRGDGNNMCEAVRNGTKIQSIRKKPIKAGTKPQIWAGWRGMKKGLYCESCFTYQENPPLEPMMGHRCQKCDAIRGRIVQLCGDLPRIELFARKRVEDWDAWGNEIEEG